MMLNSIKSNLIFHKNNSLTGILIFWAILLTIMILSLFINTATDATVGLFISHHSEQVNETTIHLGTGPEGDGMQNNKTVSTAAAAFPAIIIFSIIIGLISQPENYSFLIGLGSSRRAFFIAQVIALTLIGYVNAAIFTLAYTAESVILPMIGLHQLNFQPFYAFTMNAFTSFIFQGLTFSLVSAFFMLIAALFYRFGGVPTIIGFVALITISTILPDNLKEWLFYSPIEWFFVGNSSLWILLPKLLLMLLILWSIGWMILRKTPAK